MIDSSETPVYLATDHQWSDEEQEEEMTQGTFDNRVQYVGDALKEEKEVDVTRIYFQNLNGLKWDKYGGTWPLICQAMAEIKVDIMGFAEVNEDTSKYEIKMKMESVAAKHFEQQKLITGTSNRVVRKTFKPGGTMMMTTNGLVLRIQGTSRDRMGRWVATRYQGESLSKLTVIMAYQVCQMKRTGHNTAANQQINMILEESVAQGLTTRRNPREAFIDDLTKFIQSRLREGDRIILLGDFNETIAETNSGINRLFMTCGLIDVFGLRLGSTTSKPQTYKRSNRRIDFVGMSPEVYEAVVQIGYEPFDYRGIHSDHRGMYIDLATETIFGNKTCPIQNARLRDFTADKPEVVVKYIATKYNELVNHNIESRVERLEQLSHPDHDLAERIDRDMVRSAFIAAKAVQATHRTPWSPKLANVWAEIHMLKMIKSQLRNSQLHNWSAIFAWRDKYPGIVTEIPRTVSETDGLLKEAYHRLKMIRQEAEALRQQHLEERAMLYEALEQQNKARIVRRIQRAEELHRCYRKLKYIRKDSDSAGIREIQVPIDSRHDPKECTKDPTLWRTVRAPKEIQELLIARNRKHFGQAQGTPLTDPELLAEVKYDGTGITAEMILEGEYEATDLDEVSRLFIKHMSRKSTTTLPTQITKDEFLGKIKNWPEKTTTSPSGIHLGHYQVLRKRHNFNPTKQCQELAVFEAQRDVIIRTHLALLNYALKFGYSYERWHKVVNVMLKKDKENSYIHRLRVIHLYEADYNLLLGVKWRAAIHYAEDARLLNEGLYGSRPGRSAHDPVFIDIMQNEIYRSSMKSGVTHDLDATSCYDRILAWIANVCSRRVGVHHTVAAVNCKTLERARFHLKTELNVSEEFYQHCEEYPIYGTGQGSGNSPALWCFVSSALFDAFEERANGASFYSYDGKHSIKLYMIGFVDDCSQKVNFFKAHPQPTASRLIATMKKDAQLWNDLLWSSGGALELSKCSFQLIESDWSGRGRPFLKGTCDAPSLIISNNDGHIQIRQLSNYHSRRSLGVHLSPGGMMNKQYEILLQRSRKYAEAAMTNVLTMQEANIMFHGIFIPSITYPMPLTYLSEGQCHGIEIPFTKAILPRCGYNRSMSRGIRYAPIPLGGAGFLNLYVEQSILGILTALKHLRSPSTQPGKMLLIAITWAQAHAGVSWPIWENPDRVTPSIPNPWIMGVRKALSKMGARIIMSQNYVQPLLRENDWYLMDKALELQQFSKTEIEDINAYRRYYQVTTAADIADAKGVQIREDIWEGEGTPSSQEFSQEMFNQVKPNRNANRTWRKFLKLVANESRYLHQPLGNWIVTYECCRRRPEWLYDAESSGLFNHITGNYYVRCEKIGRYYRRPESQAAPVQNPPPGGAYPISALEIGPLIIPRSNFVPQSEPMDKALSFEAHLRQLETWEYQLLANVQLNETPDRTIELLNDGSVLFVASDGSVSRSALGSFSFVVTHVQSKTQIASGNGPVPASNPSSFRAEAYGVLAACRFLYQISQFTGIQVQQRIRHWIDNKSVVNRIRKELARSWATSNHTLARDWDVMTEITETLKRLPGIQYSAHWIKSHQDSEKAYDELTLAAQMNCDADVLAADFHNSAQGQGGRRRVPMMPHTKAQLILNDSTLTSNYKKELRYAATIPSLHSYLQTRYGWDRDLIKSLDWEVLSELIQARSVDRRPTLVKHLHSIAPTGKYAHRNDRHIPDACPACQEHGETNDHIMCCTAASRQQWRTDTIRLMSSDVGTAPTENPLASLLVEGIKQALRDPTAQIQKDIYHPTYHKLIDDQNKIGWLNLFRCRWTKEWRRQYALWLDHQGSPKSEQAARGWVGKKGQTLLNQWWKLWKLRNDERHGSDEARTVQCLSLVVRSKLEELYEKRRKVMHIDQDIFPCSSANEHFHSGQPLTVLHDWCLDNGPAIYASCTQAEKLGVLGTGNIQSYFRSVRSNMDSVSTENACSS